MMQSTKLSSSEQRGREIARLGRFVAPASPRAGKAGEETPRQS